MAGSGLHKVQSGRRGFAGRLFVETVSLKVADIILLTDFPIDFAGGAEGDYIGRNILCHDAARTDDRIIADRDAGKNYDIGADPAAASDFNREGIQAISPGFG